MTDTKMIEGMVESIEAEDTTKRGRWGSVKIGGNYYKYSDPQYRDAAWNPPTAVGQTVKVRYSESAYIKQDGQPGITRWVSGIETVTDDIEFEDGAVVGVAEDKVVFRNTTQSSIARSVALKAAVEWHVGNQRLQEPALTDSDILLTAEFFLTFLEPSDGG